MKTVTCTLLSFSILFCGCFTESSVTKDELAPGESKVIFYLKDGSYIKSYSDHHHRVEGGYQISGTLVRKGGFPQKFDGMVLYNEIERFGVDKFSVAGTVVGVGIASLVIAGVVVAASTGNFSLR